MVFSSLTFLLVFLPVFFILYFLSSKILWRNGVLLIASLLFYAWGEPVWIVLMLLSTLVNWLCGLGIGKSSNRTAQRAFLAIGVAVSLAALAYFKYAGFFLDTLAALTARPIEAATPRLPIGISFYTFQIITYTVDVYRKKVAVQRDPFRLLLYVSCFPQLIAGPIVQYGDIEERLNRRRVSMASFTDGMKRFALGLGKKVLLANLCGTMLSGCVQADAGAALSVSGAWLAAILYSMQLYYDFSAYSDMAIGLGQTIGFRYRENFTYPYIASSATEFWRRWHISLGAFFREYVYIPLGGNRRGAWRTVLNLLIVWALTGLWHGASWNFVVWGLYYGVILIVERFLLARFLAKLPSAIQHIGTLLVIVVGWVLFYYTDFSAISAHLLAMCGLSRAGGMLHGAALIDDTTLFVFKRYTVLPLIMALLCTPVVPWLSARLEGLIRREQLRHALGTAALTAVMLLSFLFLIGQSYNPFIYFRF